MTFFISKVLWELLRPSTFLLVIALAGTVLLWSRWWRVGRVLAAVTLSLLLVPSLLPLGVLLAAPLENLHTPADLPPQVTGILVLGGAEMPKTSAARGQLNLSEGGERLLLALELARRYPSAKLVFSGVTGTVYGSGSAEAYVTRDLFRTFGIGEERLIVEGRSRNTFENVRYSQVLLRPKATDNWVVVTSAMHMPRTLGLFAKAGWRVLPYPVDYQTTGRVRFAPTLRFSENLYAFDAVLREWVGLLSYRLMGRTDALFLGNPAPDATLSSR